MTFPEFDKFFDAFVDECKTMRDSKGKEYAHSESRFANFDRLADRLSVSRTVVAEIYLTKHMDAIESYISKGRTYSTETIRGRIIDAVTYLILIAGMIQEQSDMDKGIENVMITCPACKSSNFSLHPNPTFNICSDCNCTYLPTTTKPVMLPACPKCQSTSIGFPPNGKYYTCNKCGHTFIFDPPPVFIPYPA